MFRWLTTHLRRARRQLTQPELAEQETARREAALDRVREETRRSEEQRPIRGHRGVG